MTSTPAGLPPPGWYPNPGGTAAERWWDGDRWTAHVRPGVPAAVRPGSPLPPHPAAPSGQPGPPARPRLPARAAWWGLAGVAAGLVLSLLLQFVAYLIAPDSQALMILFGEIGLWTALAGACVVASRRYGTGRLTDDYGLRIRPGDALTGMAAFVGCVVAAGVVGSLFAHTSLQGSNTGIIKNQKGNDVGLVVVALIASVGAPIFEELFFRGFLRLAFETRLGATGAIVAQAACFGLAHYQADQGWGAVSVIAGTMAIGLVLGYVAHATGRLGPGMVAHGMFNLVVTLTIALAPA